MKISAPPAMVRGSVGSATVHPVRAAFHPAVIVMPTPTSRYKKKSLMPTPTIQPRKPSANLIVHREPLKPNHQYATANADVRLGKSEQHLPGDEGER